MPRKKQKGPAARPNRPGPPAKQGQTPSQSKPKTKGAGTADAPQNQKKGPLQANQRPIVPFLRGDRVLLVGEGDFSFARSLATQYKCHKLYATCYDSQETLLGKYPQAEQNIFDILQAPASKSKSKSKSNAEKASAEPEAEAEGEADSKLSIDQQQTTPKNQNQPKILYSVDARKLGVAGGGGKELKSAYPRKERKRPSWMIEKAQQLRQKQEQNVRQLLRPEPEAKPVHSGPWDVICFNFPHVGGLSTDVNRQVRANQELLVGFFKACVPLLSAAPVAIDPDDDEWEDEEEDEEDEDEDEDDDEEEEGGDGGDQSSGKEVRTGPGQILVSLFEGEPYTLWNIKDLARHAGLQVVTSFRFPWTSYEGYSHARTLGEVEGKNGARGGWRGEDREARMYVFEVKKEAADTEKKNKKGGVSADKKKKRARTEDDSDDSE
ncbi:hypothetical protein N7466_006942 [Penicillium verhagenii]|uniref:uncharacterized protein n=1 Tax=Penicillium verhagenii TaxID=1562060 RepID=UPI002545AF45|nr:uncharacterized protein N7466_006942 [Penicillium verhagenii]KAJ5927986.1 hypothetical protein N7466_006942 [Penicillium verhagenii]